MDLYKLPAILARWWYVFVLVVVVAVVSLGATVARTPATYEARVTIQMTAPNVEDVQLLAANNRSSSILRDDLLLVRNDFTAIVQSSEVRKRTVRQINLQDQDRDYTVTTARITDSNYLDLVVRSRTPDLAQAIANNHAQLAIQYYGELRSKPAQSTADFLDGQLQTARATITSLQKAAAGGTGFNSPELQQALSNYQILLQKRSDALLAAQNAARVPYIQVVAPAVEATKPTMLKAYGTIAGLTLVGSLGLALLLVLLLETLFPAKDSIRPALENPTTVNGVVSSSGRWG